jgi:dynein heavy chain
MVESVLDVYYKVRLDLLPTPSKSHYTFNMRDVNRVLQGMCSVHPKHGNDITILCKLWYHENMRVFHDRLTTDEDREYFKTLLSTFFESFGRTPVVVLDLERIIFADYLAGKDAEPRYYAPVEELQQYINKMDAF